MDTKPDTVSDTAEEGKDRDVPSAEPVDGNGEGKTGEKSIQDNPTDGAEGTDGLEGEVSMEGLDDDEGSSEVIMSDPIEGPPHEGKRVKVYELRDSSWFDRGTGYCKGIYDDTQDLALLIVEAEDTGPEKGIEEGEGGFLKEELLLTARVEKDDIYVRQQVWTEPSTTLDIALSFQDAEGCEDIWQFIAEVQRHLNNLPADHQAPSSPLSASPVLGVGTSQMNLVDPRTTWEPPSLSNIKQQEMWLRMQAKSAQGRERAVEHIIGEDYIKQLTVVFDQAEDLESLEDLHALCSLMQTILMFNDNTLLEYILQDDIFMGVIGIFEYDPDFPHLKASYRQFFSDVAKFRQVVEIRDPSIRTKIHHLFRVQYLRDVVLARMLDDGTFGILNGFVFFTQVDIINYIQGNDAFLNELLSGFRDERPGSPNPDSPLDERRRDIVLLLNQLMILGKGVQLPNRLALYRNLIDRGLLYAVEWSFRRNEAQLLHAGAEILTLAVELDVNAVRMHVLKEDEAKRRSLIVDIIALLSRTKNMGLLSQVGDSLRNLLDTSGEENTFLQRKEGPISDNFMQSFYENCVGTLYRPLLDSPEIKAGAEIPKIPREKTALLYLLIELLSASISNNGQLHRVSFFILSNPISRKIVSLVYVKDKPLRHAALRFIRACLKQSNHFINRYFIKNDLLLPLVDVLESESSRDNMLSSTCMEVLDHIRRENLKPIINYLFEKCRSRLEALSKRPYLRRIIFGLTVRWQQNNEPPPPPVQPEAESSNSWQRTAAAQEEDYFNASDEDDDVIGPKMPSTASAATTTASGVSTISPQKRKRSAHNSPLLKRPSAPSPGKMSTGNRTTAGGAGLVDYDDASDSDGSSGAQSPVVKAKLSIQPSSPTPASTAATLDGDATLGGEVKEGDRLEEDLGDIALKMRAKRAREEEEEEGFGGLLMNKAKDGAGDASANTGSVVMDKEASLEVEEKKDDVAAKKEGKKDEGGKKIRLSFGSLKKFGSGGK